MGCGWAAKFACVEMVFILIIKVNILELWMLFTERKWCVACKIALLKWYGTDDDFCEYGCTCEWFICENYAFECVN